MLLPACSRSTAASPTAGCSVGRIRNRPRARVGRVRCHPRARVSRVVPSHGEARGVAALGRHPAPLQRRQHGGDFNARVVAAQVGGRVLVTQPVLRQTVGSGASWDGSDKFYAGQQRHGQQPGRRSGTANGRHLPGCLAPVCRCRHQSRKCAAAARARRPRPRPRPGPASAAGCRRPGRGRSVAERFPRASATRPAALCTGPAWRDEEREGCSKAGRATRQSGRQRKHAGAAAAAGQRQQRACTATRYSVCPWKLGKSSGCCRVLTTPAPAGGQHGGGVSACTRDLRGAASACQAAWHPCHTAAPVAVFFEK